MRLRLPLRGWCVLRRGPLLCDGLRRSRSLLSFVLSGGLCRGRGPLLCGGLRHSRPLLSLVLSGDLCRGRPLLRGGLWRSRSLLGLVLSGGLCRSRPLLRGSLCSGDPLLSLVLSGGLCRGALLCGSLGRTLGFLRSGLRQRRMRRSAPRGLRRWGCRWTALSSGGRREVGEVRRVRRMARHRPPGYWLGQRLSGRYLRMTSSWRQVREIRRARRVADCGGARRRLSRLLRGLQTAMRAAGGRGQRAKVRRALRMHGCR